MSDREKNYFSIVANGEKFDVDRYIQHSALSFDSVWHQGEQLVDSASTCRNSGVEIALGCGRELDVADQQLIAVSFLEANEKSLKELRSCPGVTAFYLGLQETVFPDSMGSIFDLSPSLMRVALTMGVGVTIWACLSKEPFGASEQPK